jgi:hypothetical protein
VVRYANYHRSPVPTLHRPNRPVATILYGILIVGLVLAHIELLREEGIGANNNIPLHALFPWIIFAFIIYVTARLRRNYMLPADKVLALDTRQPVLYLRSFSADRVRLWGKGVVGKVRRKSIDEAVAPLASKIGPFVAIANPDSKLPHLGAAKAYHTNDTWRSAVSEWVTTAQMIVW